MLVMVMGKKSKKKIKKANPKRERYKLFKKVKPDKLITASPELEPELRKQSQQDIENMESWFKRRPKYKKKER